MTEVQAAIVRYLRSLTESAGLLRRPVVLLPFITLSALELVLLTDYVNFSSTTFPGLAVRLLASLVDESVWHYPTHVFMLPIALECIRYAVWLCVGFVIVAWAVPPMSRHLGQTYAFGVARGFVWRLAVTSVVFAGAAIAVRLAIAGVVSADLLPRRLDPAVNLAAVMVYPFLLIVISYAAVHLLESAGVRRGTTRTTARLTLRRLPVSIMIVLTYLVASTPFYYLQGRTAWFVGTGSPEFAVNVAIAFVAWDALIRCLLVGAAVSVSLGAGEVPE